ncbi:MAG: hypothetical protein IKI84_13825 [Clostridia bacterium]|nr:hypothetical protein [Clostridia bacterium]
MKRRILSLTLAVLQCLIMLDFPASAEDRVVLMIGDSTTRSGSRFDPNKGMWRYVSEKAGGRSGMYI